MKQDTDKMLRNKMLEVSPEDLIDSFDEDAIWQQIQQKNAPEKSKKKLYVFQYWPYAAVLAIGLFLGFYLNKNSGSETIYAQKVVSKQTVIDTVFVPNLIVHTPANIALTPSKIAAQKVVKIAAVTEPKKEVQHHLNRESGVEPPSEEAVIPVAPKQELAVVYFDDLNSTKENKNYIVAKKKRRKLIELNVPNESKSTSQELPFRNILFASNK